MNSMLGTEDKKNKAKVQNFLKTQEESKDRLE